MNISELCDSDIGREVVYNDGNRPSESGVITSYNMRFVFVRYGSDKHSKATPPWKLGFAQNQPAKEE